MAHIAQRSVRAVLIDDRSRLVLIRRTRPGAAPYWMTPGGAVAHGDVSREAALRRELAAELGAQVDRPSQVFVISTPIGTGTAVQYFYACRLLSTGTAPSRGDHDVELVSLLDGSLTTINLKPDALREFVLANRDALLAEVGQGS